MHSVMYLIEPADLRLTFALQPPPAAPGRD
jgi:hypothetical protein